MLRERECVCEVERERIKNRESKSTNFRRTPTAEGKKTQEFWEPWTKKRCWLLALIAKGCPYKSLPFPEQPGPSLLWARSNAFNDALCHLFVQPSPQEDAIPLPPPLLLRGTYEHIWWSCTAWRDLLGVPRSARPGAGWGHTGAALGIWVIQCKYTEGGKI